MRNLVFSNLYYFYMMCFFSFILVLSSSIMLCLAVVFFMSLNSFKVWKVFSHYLKKNFFLIIRLPIFRLPEIDPSSSALLICMFFQTFFFSCVLFWVISIFMVLLSLIFSFAISNLLLIPLCVFFYLGYYFHLFCIFMSIVLNVWNIL